MWAGLALMQVEILANKTANTYSGPDGTGAR